VAAGRGTTMGGFTSVSLRLSDRRYFILLLDILAEARLDRTL
jgi:hypothetical protein